MFSIVARDSVDSTQDELRRILESSASLASISNSESGVSGIGVNTRVDNANAITSLKQDSNPPLCVIAQSQTKGRGSRGNVWVNEKALMFSFAYSAPLVLPSDVPTQSIAMFLGCVVRDILREFGSQVWLKYPNDLYIDMPTHIALRHDCAKKLGGILVEIWRGILLCGIGINLASKEFGELDIALDEIGFLTRLYEKLQNPPSWKQIFSNYKLEFHRNYPYTFHASVADDAERVSLRDAILLEDGGISVNGRVIYTLRDCRE